MCAEEVMDNAAGRNQYFTFLLGDEVFALEIGKVREVLEYTTITKVPRMPEFMRGVINLRGNVVPVIDLRYKLGMGTVTRTVDTCIIIVEIMIDGEIIPMGALADSVKEVTELNPDQISPPPKMGIQVDNRFIRGWESRERSFSSFWISKRSLPPKSVRCCSGVGMRRLRKFPRKFSLAPSRFKGKFEEPYVRGGPAGASPSFPFIFPALSGGVPGDEPHASVSDKGYARGGFLAVSGADL